MPQAPADDRDRNCPLIVGAIDGRCARGAAVLQRVAGLDIAKARVEVTIGCPATPVGPPPAGDPDVRHHPPQAGVARGLAALLGVAKAGMEATSAYWKPVFFLLESRGFDYNLYNAAQVRALPGQPKERADSIWLAKITERGMIAASFVPPGPSARCGATPASAGTSSRPLPPRSSGWRNCSKTASEALVGDLQHPRRLGRDMLDALAAGQRDPRALAAMARGKMRGKIRSWKRRWSARSSPLSTPPCWR